MHPEEEGLVGLDLGGGPRVRCAEHLLLVLPFLEHLEASLETRAGQELGRQAERPGCETASDERLRQDWELVAQDSLVVEDSAHRRRLGGEQTRQ